MTLDGALAIVLRPVMAVAMFAAAYFIARAVMWFVPPGRVRETLQIRLHVVPVGPVSRHTTMAWRWFFALLVLLIIVKPFRYL